MLRSSSSLFVRAAIPMNRDLGRVLDSILDPVRSSSLFVNACAISKILGRLYDSVAYSCSMRA